MPPSGMDLPGKVKAFEFLHLGSAGLEVNCVNLPYMEGVTLKESLRAALLFSAPFFFSPTLLSSR